MKEFKLDNEPKITSGFTVPEGYFDTFPGQFLTQLPKQETKIISIFRAKKAWYFTAAAIVVLMLCLPVYNNYKLHQEEVDMATLEDYIAYHSTISEEDIVKLLDKEDLEKIQIDLKIQDKDIEETLGSNSDLEQYITD